MRILAHALVSNGLFVAILLWLLVTYGAGFIALRRARKSPRLVPICLSCLVIGLCASLAIYIVFHGGALSVFWLMFVVGPAVMPLMALRAIPHDPAVRGRDENA